jgi:hypothetical protein
MAIVGVRVVISPASRRPRSDSNASPFDPKEWNSSDFSSREAGSLDLYLADNLRSLHPELAG